MIHTSIDTLPVDCFMKIQHSISEDKRDMSWLIVRDEYYTPYTGEIPDTVDDAWINLFFDFGKGQIDTKVQVELAAIAYLKNRMVVTKDNSLQIEIDIKLDRLRGLLDKQKKFDISQYYKTCASIETNLNIRMFPFQTTVRQYFGYIDANLSLCV